MSDHSDLIERLRVCAADTMWADHAEVSKALLTRAASALSSQSLSLSEAREEIERLGEALKPFAKAAEDCGVEDDLRIGVVKPADVIWESAVAVSITYAHVESARSALENGPAVLADANTNTPLSDLSSLRKGAEVAVKPLEWDEHPGDQFCRTFWQAKGFGGHYVVEVRHTGDFDMWLPETSSGQRFATPEAAKSAAQSDFETRIRSALVSGSREEQS